MRGEEILLSFVFLCAQVELRASAAEEIEAGGAIRVGSEEWRCLNLQGCVTEVSQIVVLEVVDVILHAFVRVQGDVQAGLEVLDLSFQLLRHLEESSDQWGLLLGQSLQVTIKLPRLCCASWRWCEVGMSRVWLPSRLFWRPWHAPFEKVF